MNILFLSSWFPYPPINGAKIRINNLVRELAKRHEVTLLAFARTIPIEEARSHMPALETFCKSVGVVQARSFLPDTLASYRQFFSTLPRAVVQTYSPEMENIIRQKIANEQFDLVIASEVGPPATVSLLASKIRSIPTILDALEIGMIRDPYKNETSPIKQLRHGLTWYKQKNFSKQMLLQADACTVPSVQEQQNLREIVGDVTPIKVIPHSLDLAQYADSCPTPTRGTMAFTGSFTYFPNADAALYFLEEIFPLIKQRVPDALLKIIGSTEGIDPQRMKVNDSVILTGLLKDVRPVVASSWLSIVPLRFGAGTRLKIIESMALGTPVISTSKGAEGLVVTHEKNILIADDPADFARLVVEVMVDAALRRRLSEEGRKLVRERYSSTVMGNDLDSLAESIRAAKGAGARSVSN